MLKGFAKFTDKQASEPATLLKRDSSISAFLWILTNLVSIEFGKLYFCETEIYLISIVDLILK